MFSLLVHAKDKAEAHQMINDHSRLSLSEIYLDHNAGEKNASGGHSPIVNESRFLVTTQTEGRGVLLARTKRLRQMCTR